MGSLPQLSVVKGSQRDLKQRLVHKIFEDNLLHTECKSKPALIWNDLITKKEHITSYEKLNINANRIALSIQSLIKQNQSKPNQDGDWIIAVCMSPSDSLITILLAIWKSGAAYLPIDASFPDNRIEHIINEAKPVLVIHDQYSKSSNNNVFATNQTNQILLDNLLQHSQSQNSNNIEVKNTLCGSYRNDNIENSNDIAIVLYTSGSTGVPKGVRLPHSIILNRLKWQFEVFPYSVTEKIGVFKTALTFVDSCSELWGPLLNEMAILIIPKEITKDPERLVDALELYKIERLILVPTLLRTLLIYLPLKNQSNLLHNLKLWICSGEPLPTSLGIEFFNYFHEGTHVLCNFYGSTEIMGDVTYFVCEGKKQLQNYDKVPIGYPINNTVIYLLDDDYRPVKVGETGELYVSGLNLASGYVNGRDQFRFIENPLATDPKYNRLYKTGDHASILKGGILQYEGRTDSQIKVRGYRVDLSEVEKNLFSLADVDKGIVLCYHAGEIDQAILAFVTLMPDAVNIQQGLQIEKMLTIKLAEYMIPQVIIIENLPHLVNGKIDRQSLLKMYENTNNNDDSIIHIDYDFTGIPEYQLNVAKDLYETIGQVIGRSTRTTITKNCNFYQLGGNSMNSIVTVAQLRNKGYFISITDFISSKSIGDMLNKISVGVPIDESNNSKDCHQMYKVFPLTFDHKNEVVELMSLSFLEKADLEGWLRPQCIYENYTELYEQIYPTLVEQKLSFVVMDNESRIVGAALNFDGNNEPTANLNSKLTIIFEFLEFIEEPLMDQLPKGLNKIFHTSMIGTTIKLSPQENIHVIQFIEDEIIRLAKRNNFVGIFTTNTNPLTQQLGTHVFGYETLLDYQVNQYVHSDGTKPFGEAPDTQRAIAQWKNISDA